MIDYTDKEKKGPFYIDPTSGIIGRTVYNGNLVDTSAIVNPNAVWTTGMGSDKISLVDTDPFNSSIIKAADFKMPSHVYLDSAYPSNALASQGKCLDVSLKAPDSIVTNLAQAAMDTAYCISADKDLQRAGVFLGDHGKYNLASSGMVTLRPESKDNRDIVTSLSPFGTSNLVLDSGDSAILAKGVKDGLDLRAGSPLVFGTSVDVANPGLAVGQSYVTHSKLEESESRIHEELATHTKRINELESLVVEKDARINELEARLSAMHEKTSRARSQESRLDDVEKKIAGHERQIGKNEKDLEWWNRTAEDIKNGKRQHL